MHDISFPYKLYFYLKMRLSEEMVAVTYLSLPHDLQNSDLSDISNGEEVEDISDGIPNSFVQLLDSMTVESDEDEDFEGFE